MSDQSRFNKPRHFRNPQELAERGEAIYNKKYRDRFETKFPGYFAAIEVESEEAFVAGHPEEVLEQARKAKPGGVFHLIRIGSVGAFRVSYTTHGRDYRLNRQWLSGD